MDLPEDITKTNPFYAAVADQVRAMRREEFLGSGQLSLGRLIAELKAIKKPDTATVRFDFGYLYPTGFESYRGFYDELALGWTFHEDSERLAWSLLEAAEAAVGATFHGYKGGDYVMSLETPVWVARMGEAPSTILSDVTDLGWEVVLNTQHFEGA